MRRELAPLGLGVAVPLGFNNTYALAMRSDANIASLDQLATQPALKFGLSHEFIGRVDGWPGLAARYGLPQRPRGLDHGIAYEALAQRQVDVIDIYSTDAKIRQYGLRVLADTRQYFPRYDAMLLYRLDLPPRFPAAWQALQGLQGRISEGDMIAMNAAVEIDGKRFSDVAHQWLASGTQASKPSAARSKLLDKIIGDDLWTLTRQHVTLVLLSVALACLIGIPLRAGGVFGAAAANGAGLRRRAADVTIAGPAGDLDPRAGHDRHRAGPGGAIRVRAAAHRAQHVHGHLAGAARLAHGGAGAGLEPARPPAARGLAVGLARHAGGRENGGRDERGHGHHRRLHRRGWLWRTHHHRPGAERQRHAAGRRDPRCRAGPADTRLVRAGGTLGRGRPAALRASQRMQFRAHRDDGLVQDAFGLEVVLALFGDGLQVARVAFQAGAQVGAVDFHDERFGRDIHDVAPVCITIRSLCVSALPPFCVASNASAPSL